ncbi:unnamed protein product [Dracunculus medinensis]|uniref:Uncharacterized protein n=1 Tax=Dracunculus medinensis TaxID=318479 RepID=A0A0N4U908_DRAME|nr:unnamed protein product [Dracunculus medinensis]
MLNIRENCTKLDTQNLQALNIPTSKVNVDFGISQLRVLIVRPFKRELYLCVIVTYLLCFPFKRKPNCSEGMILRHQSVARAHSSPV